MPGELLSPNSWANTSPSNAFWFGANQIAPNLTSLLRQQPAPYFPDPNTPNAQGKLPDSSSWDRIDPRYLSAFGEAAQQGVNMVGPPMKAAATAAVPLVAAIARRGVMPAVEEAANVAKGIRAYHGSPYDFEKFDLSKIGTGEGAQAYGHGLYFAENEGVARSYRDNLAGSTELMREEHSLLQQLNSIDLDHPDRMAIEKRLGEVSKELKVERGKMYEVNINAKPEQFLDWDKKLRDMPLPVQERLGQLGFDPNTPQGGLIGSQIYQQAQNRAYDRGLTSSFSEEGPQAMGMLREAGIPGIKYLDQGSRSAGEGSSNYVVFNDKIIDILRKYGLAGLIAGGAAADSLPIPQQQPPVFSK